MQWGGVSGGCDAPQWCGGTPGSVRSNFFCLLCLNNYSKIFQKRRTFKLLLEGTQVGNPLGGAPLRPLGPPQGPPGVLEIWKKLQVFPKIIYKITCTKIPQILTLTPTLGNLSYWGGPWGAQMVFWPVPGFFRKRERWFFF